MARGERKSIETKISEIEAKKAQFQTKIDAYKAKISDLDAEIKGLQDDRKQKELANLLNVIQQSGKTPEEVMSALNLN